MQKTSRTLNTRATAKQFIETQKLECVGFFHKSFTSKLFNFLIIERCYHLGGETKLCTR